MPREIEQAILTAQAPQPRHVSGTRVRVKAGKNAGRVGRINGDYDKLTARYAELGCSRPQRFMVYFDLPFPADLVVMRADNLTPMPQELAL